jgi:hypothetical protein
MSFGMLPISELSFYSVGASSCKSMTYMKRYSKITCGAETTPSFYRRYSKSSLGRGLVKISAIFSFVPTYSTLMFFSTTYSRRK